MIFPDYNRSLLSVTSAVCAYYGEKTQYPPLDEIAWALQKKRPRNVILIVLDGLGHNPLMRHLDDNAFLRKNCVSAISSVFPPTTTAATTSLWTGLSPLEHGWLGWSLYFREIGRTVDLFFDRDSFSGERYSAVSPAGTYMPYETIYVRIGKHADTHALFPFRTQAAAGAAHEYVYSSVEELCATILSIAAKPGEKLICAYVMEPDHIMHEHGVHSARAKGMFERLDALMKQTAEGLDEDSFMIITADHGLVDVTEPVILSAIEPLCRCLVLPPMIEARAASLFVKAHKREEFQREFTRRFSGDFLLLTREEIYEKNLFGRGTPHPKADDFIGDFVAVATGSRYIMYKTPASRSHTKIGQHAGLTEDEMLVPVILCPGGRKHE